MSTPARPTQERLRVWGANGLLLLAAIIWGIAFVAQKRASAAGVSVFPVLAMRFLMGALVLLPLAIWRWPRTAAANRRRSSLWIGGIAAGTLMFLASALQQAGLATTDSGVAGFITGLYIIFVPLIGLLLGIKSRWPVWVGAAMAILGLYLLCWHEKAQVNPGDLLVLGCAVVWALHVLVVGWAAPKTDAIVLSVVQFVVTGVLGTIAALCFTPEPLHGAAEALWPIVYLGVAAVAGGFTLQVVGQAVAPPAYAALILGLESVFAAIAGALWLDEKLTPIALAGCVLMLAGTVLSQVIKPPSAAERS